MTLTDTTNCKTCGGKCCRHYPHIREKELPKIKEFLGEDPYNAAKPYESLPGYWKFSIPCPLFDEETGCRLPYNDRPMICRLYPFSPLPCKEGYILLLDVAGCPSWMDFGQRYKEAEAVFVKILEEK